MKSKIIALDDLDFLFTTNEIIQVKKAYRQKLNILKISEILKRPQEEVAILIMHMGRKGII